MKLTTSKLVTGALATSLIVLSAAAQATSLTLEKVVVNDNGGTATPAEWTLTAVGPSGFSGSGPTVSNTELEPGPYELFESGGPDGYTASAWVCDHGTQVDANTVTRRTGRDRHLHHHQRRRTG